MYELLPGVKATRVGEILTPRSVLSDRATFNGHSGQLDLGICDLEFTAAVNLLRELLKDHPHAANASALLIEVADGADWATRFLLLPSQDPNKCLLFTLRLPRAALQPAAAEAWPDGLPRPQGVRFDSILGLAKNRVVYASWSSPAPAAVLRRDYQTQLEDAGWRPLTKAGQGSGVYLWRNQRMLVVSSGEDDGRAFAAIFVRDLSTALDKP